MPHINMANANAVQDALQAAHNALARSQDDTISEQASLLVAIGIMATAKDRIADAALRSAAVRKHIAGDEIEIDDEPATSEADGGTWVAAWVWVKAEPDMAEYGWRQSDAAAAQACGWDLTLIDDALTIRADINSYSWRGTFQMECDAQAEKHVQDVADGVGSAYTDEYRAVCHRARAILNDEDVDAPPACTHCGEPRQSNPCEHCNGFNGKDA